MASLKRPADPIVKAGNAKILAAWKQGSKLTSFDGKRPNTAAIKKASGGNASEAEKLRKSRAMSKRIDRKNSIKSPVGALIKSARGDQHCSVSSVEYQER